MRFGPLVEPFSFIIAHASSSSFTLMPNARLPASVPASDWNIRSIGQPQLAERLHLHGDVREHAVLRRDLVALQHVVDRA